MSRTALAIPEQLWAELTAWLDEPTERAGILLARVIDDGDGLTLLARALHDVPDDSYERRQLRSLAVRSTGWVPAVRSAADDDAAALFVHSHPGGTARFSVWDDQVDEDLASVFIGHTGKAVYGALLVAGSRDASTAAARTVNQYGDRRDIDVIRVVGDGLRLITRRPGPTDEAHDRQVRLLGMNGQAVLEQARVGIVGAGGTGSPTFEQLVRLGVKDITLIDDDVVTASTVARGYGSTVSDIDRPKVEVLAEHANNIGLGTMVNPVLGNLRSREVTHHLRHCDIVFCCVDGHGARAVLNRWAYGHIAPVIDLAVLVTGDGNGERVNIDGRVTWLAPGAACLLCRGRVDPHLAYVEQLDPEARRALAQQGYVPDLDEPQPSVVAYTTLMSSLAVSEFLNRLFGFATDEPTEMIARVTDRSLRLNRRPPRDGCFCTEPARLGAGLTEPYLDILWAD